MPSGLPEHAPLVADDEYDDVARVERADDRFTRDRRLLQILDLEQL